jgi:hypothetical protein
LVDERVSASPGAASRAWEAFSEGAAAAARGLERIGRARFYRSVGQGMAGWYRGTPRAAVTSDRFYRRALRALDGSGAGAAAELPEGEPLVEVSGRRLRAAWWGLLVRRGRRLALWKVGAAAGLACALIVAIPPLRHRVFPPDLAAGRPWTATSAFPGFATKGVMADPGPGTSLIHTIDERFPAITIDLGRVARVRRVTVENRVDCCRDRTQPLAIELSVDGKAWTRVGYRRVEFDSWTAKFPATPARFVRARIDRTSTLHLRRIHVYA